MIPLKFILNLLWIYSFIALPRPTTAIDFFRLTPKRDASEGSTATGGASLAPLWKCAPCGSDTCSFRNESYVEPVEFDIILGVPISNCGSNSATPIDGTIQGQLTVGES
ncbi:hypothetical protein CPB86DRAFT_310840 [Serendipita vermifera]|nr:hypothetical protein CPB86DRAFT_310840 [Serendipita vermifera]